MPVGFVLWELLLTMRWELNYAVILSFSPLYTMYSLHVWIKRFGPTIICLHNSKLCFTFSTAVKAFYSLTAVSYSTDDYLTVVLMSHSVFDIQKGIQKKKERRIQELKWLEMKRFISGQSWDMELGYSDLLELCEWGLLDQGRNSDLLQPCAWVWPDQVSNSD